MCGWLLLCANDVVVEDALAQLWSPESDAAAAAVAGLREALRRSPTDPGRWCDLGTALQRSGASDDAGYCFEQALRFGPHSPPILLRAAFFYDEVQRVQESRSAFRRILELTRDYDPIVFGYFERTEQPVEEVLEGAIPDEAEPLVAYFRFQVGRANPGELAVIWRRLVERGLTDSLLLAEYVRRQIAGHRLEDAVAAQAAFVGGVTDEWPERNLIFNSGFEDDFLGTDLSWSITERDGMLINRTTDVSHTGNYSLHIRFGGGVNVNFRDLSQAFVAAPGRYRCTAFVRSENLTTDRGISLRIHDPADQQRLNLSSEEICGTKEWTELSIDLSVTGEPRLLKIEVERSPSRMFDNKISGSVWIDDVACVAIQ